MAFEKIVFYLFAAILVYAATRVITVRNPVHAALGLVLTLFGVAVQFVAMEAHFLAAVQVIVYAGAIVVLFLFVIITIVDLPAFVVLGLWFVLQISGAWQQFAMPAMDLGIAWWAHIGGFLAGCILMPLPAECHRQLYDRRLDDPSVKNC